MKLRVSYAKSSYKNRTYTTPLVQYSYRDKNGTPRNKTVVSLAKLPKSVVKVVDEVLKRGDTSVLDNYVPKTSFRYQFSICVGAAFVAFGILLQLGVIELLKKHLTKPRSIAIIAFIIERIISEKPLSISALRRQMPDSPTHYILGSPSNPNLNIWYWAFGDLEAVREKILSELYKRNQKKGQVFLYDITSSYFEGNKCPLGELGYNRDGKKGKKQVVIGIICDSLGRPIWCDVFKGNTSDQTTIKQQLLNLRDKLGVKEFIFVGDRGMITNARIKELEKDGWWETFNYITALKRQEVLSLINDEDHPIQPELFDHRNLVELEHDGVRYVLCYNPYKLNEDRQTRERLLDKTEEKLKLIAKNVKDGRLKRKDKIARRLYRCIDKWGMERFFNVEYDEGFFKFKRNEDEIERFSSIDGCYVIRANVDKNSLSHKDLVNKYKDLKYVEQAFRTMKTTDINLRPIRVWNTKHVKGYIFACFLSYLATWEIRNCLEPVLLRDERKKCEVGSLQEVFRSLANISVGVFDINGETHTELSRISKKNKEILKILKLPSILSFIN